MTPVVFCTLTSFPMHFPRPISSSVGIASCTCRTERRSKRYAISKRADRTIWQRRPNNVQRNEDITTGAWRPLDLTLPPFNLPKPIMLIEEESQYAPDRHFGKHLGVWQFADLRP